MYPPAGLRPMSPTFAELGSSRGFVRGSKGAVAKKYGAYRKKDGFAERALFVLDPEGKVFWSYCSPVAVNPGADGILQALEDLSLKRNNNEPVESSSFAK